MLHIMAKTFFKTQVHFPGQTEQDNVFFCFVLFLRFTLSEKKSGETMNRNVVYKHSGC